MANIHPERISTISQYYQALGLSKPEHPLISVINLADIKRVPGMSPKKGETECYQMSNGIV